MQIQASELPPQARKPLPVSPPDSSHVHSTCRAVDCWERLKDQAGTDSNTSTSWTLLQQKGCLPNKTSSPKCSRCHGDHSYLERSGTPFEVCVALGQAGRLFFATTSPTPLPEPSCWPPKHIRQRSGGSSTHTECLRIGLAKHSLKSQPTCTCTEKAFPMWNVPGVRTSCQFAGAIPLLRIKERGSSTTVISASACHGFSWLV